VSRSIAQLLPKLQLDSWRARVRFSDGVEQANRELFNTSTSHDERIKIVNEWLQSNQPCLFGVIAAKLGLITYCFLSEQDLMRSDQFISDKIQSAREQWTADGFEGASSAFIILAISENIARAKPDENMKKLARKLCSLYLQENVKTDKVYLDNIFLERRGRKTAAWMWETGINYFSAQGDKRWWQDHRFPGGMAFSVNSVGHMVKSGILSDSMNKLDSLLGLSEGWEISKVDSLDKALQLAMSTIARASNAVSGKATELLPSSAKMKCPASLPSGFADKNCREYHGYYHTDYTLPSEYFLPDVERPIGLKEHALDFTYLFDRRLDNPAYFSMGAGRRIRGLGRGKRNETLTYRVQKRRRGVEQSVLISKHERLIEALKRKNKSSQPYSR
jgi:hypothetical protein